MDLRKLGLLLSLVTVACYADRSVGVSMERGVNEPVKPKFPSRIIGQAGEALYLDSPAAGDMDGDGLDDFLVVANRSPDDEGQYRRPLLYLYYGKAEFPAQLSTESADAAFEVDGGFSGTVGDLNGDGYSDLLLTLSDGANFVFGSKERRHGLVERGTGGVRWTVGAIPPPFSPEQLIQFFVRGAGDVNGDGCADLLVGASAIISADPGEAVERQWIAPGYRGEWQATEWDASSVLADVGDAASRAPFDPGMAPTSLTPERAGDVDGDGRADLLVFSDDGSVLFYGKREYPAELSLSEADARLLSPAAEPVVEGTFDGSAVFAQRLGDLDADGKDDLAVTMNSKALQIAYGRRWTGAFELEPELEITGDTPAKRIAGAAAGDLDGDGFPELLLNVVDLPNEELWPLSAAFYIMRGTEKRLRGKIQLSESDRWDIPAPDIAGGGTSLAGLMLAGDIDGDGSQDILTSRGDDFIPENSLVFLIPSTPRAPD